MAVKPTARHLRAHFIIAAQRKKEKPPRSEILCARALAAACLGRDHRRYIAQARVWARLEEAEAAELARQAAEKSHNRRYRPRSIQAGGNIGQRRATL